ncbi:MAG TPA: carboxypeptidase-like regulatory domain-containing protein, partial [Puia sp.]|nr:carboxypeptidase-like regulatory domain-containing protein [Puia sp.]
MVLPKPAVPFIILLCFLQSRPGYCQSPARFTLTENNAPFSKVMDDLQSIAGITYLGMTDLAEQGHPVTFTVRSATLRQVLDLCFKGQPFKYRMVAGAVTILPLDAPEKKVLISGRIFGQSDEPLAGATVQVKGGGLPAVATDDSGRFRIMVPDGALLLVSSVNYEAQVVRVKAGKDVMLQLWQKINELGDVVVVSNGYQHMHRKMTTGSFDEIGNELVNRRVGPNILD